MADQQHVIAEARQAMVRLVRAMKRFMDNRPEEREFFHDLMDGSVPGMRAELDQGSGLSDAELTGRIQATQSPGWEDRTAQMIRTISTRHEMFADPAVREAVGAYLRQEEGVRQLNLAAGAVPPRRYPQAPIRQAPAADYNTRAAARVFRDLERRPAARSAQPAPTRPSAAPAGPRQPEQPGPLTTPPRGQGPASPPSAQPPQPSAAQVGQPQPGQLSRPQAGQPAQPNRAHAGQPAQPGRSQAGQQGPGVMSQGPGGAPGAAAPQRPDGPTTPTVPQRPDGPATPTATPPEFATVRTVTAAAPGPVTLNADLLGGAGSVVVRAEASCTQATLTIRTADATGPAADAVRDANLTATPDGRMEASVQATGANSFANGTFVFNGGYEVAGGFVAGDQYGVTGGQVRGDVEMNFYGNAPHVVAGHIGTLNLRDGGRSISMENVRDSAISISGGTSRVEIEAVVPPGSSLTGRTTSANIETSGELSRVDVESVSGGVTIAQADAIKVQTVNGPIETRGESSTVYAESGSGPVTIAHADTARAKTVSGPISLGSTNDGVARSTSGAVSIDDARRDAKATSVSNSATVHATGTGKVRASSVSNNATVTATSEAMAGGLDAQSQSGTTEKPAKVVAGTSRGSAGERDFNSANRTGQRQAGGAREV